RRSRRERLRVSCAHVVSGCTARQRRTVARRTGRKRREERLEAIEDCALAADHLAVTVLEPEDAAAHARVDVVDARGAELACAAYVVDIVRVAAVDDRVADRKQRSELRDDAVDGGGRD